MKKIYKYQLEVNELTLISVPKGSKFLSFKSQHDKPVVYIEVNPEVKETEDYLIYLIGTGVTLVEDIDTFTYLGTELFLQDRFVLHAYYKLYES